MPASTVCERSSRTQPSVSARAFVLDIVGAFVDPQRGHARVDQDRAGDLAVGPARGRERPAAPTSASTPCTAISASCIASRWAAVAPATSVPSMSNSSSTPARAQRSNDMPGASRLANAAISLAAASMSSSDTISTGECM